MQIVLRICRLIISYTEQWPARRSNLHVVGVAGWLGGQGWLGGYVSRQPILHLLSCAPAFQASISVLWLRWPLGICRQPGVWLGVRDTVLDSAQPVRIRLYVRSTRGCLQIHLLAALELAQTQVKLSVGQEKKRQLVFLVGSSPRPPYFLFILQ